MNLGPEEISRAARGNYSRKESFNVTPCDGSFDTALLGQERNSWKGVGEAAIFSSVMFQSQLPVCHFQEKRLS